MTRRDSRIPSGGRRLTEAQAKLLRARVPSVPDALLAKLRDAPLIGVQLSIEPEHDASGLGVEMQWMTAAQVVSEATETYPGIVAVPRGLIPIGMCLEGSGDPYFYRARDGAIVRVPHDAATETSLDEARIELVAASIDRLLELATRSA